MPVQYGTPSRFLKELDVIDNSENDERCAKFEENVCIDSKSPGMEESICFGDTGMSNVLKRFPCFTVKLQLELKFSDSGIERISTRESLQENLYLRISSLDNESTLRIDTDRSTSAFRWTNAQNRKW